jgi:hypothetical protein
MAGLGRKVFAPGEVLTATNVQNYLMDQAVQVYAGTAARGSAIGSATTEGMVSYLSDVHSLQMATGTATWVNVDGLPIVAGTATRNALYPSPVAGNTVFRSDTGSQESYYSAYSTAVPGGRDSAGWYATSRVDGLVPVQPTSVTLASGSATANALGVITFTNATSIKLNNIFNSNFLNYKVLIDITTGAAADDIILYLKLDGAGATSYNYSGVRQFGTSLEAIAVGATSLFLLGTAGRATIAGSSSDVTIMKPFAAAATRYNSHTGGNSNTSFRQDQHVMRGRLNDTSSYTAFEILPASSNISGTIQVFGFNS